MQRAVAIPCLIDDTCSRNPTPTRSSLQCRVVNTHVHPGQFTPFEPLRGTCPFRERELDV